MIFTCTFKTDIVKCTSWKDEHISSSITIFPPTNVVYFNIYFTYVCVDIYDNLSSWYFLQKLLCLFYININNTICTHHCYSTGKLFHAHYNHAMSKGWIILLRLAKVRLKSIAKNFQFYLFAYFIFCLQLDRRNYDNAIHIYRNKTYLITYNITHILSQSQCRST